jgi:DnaJ-class molecular chaperone
VTWQNRNPYELLEIEHTASIDEIEKAKKLQLSAWHPDKFPNNEFKQIASERTQAIIKACKILLNRDDREIINRKLNAEKGTEYMPQFEDDKMNIPENWKELSSFLKGLNFGSTTDRKFAYDVADKYLEKRKELSQKQIDWALIVWEMGISQGFKP